MAKQLWNSRAQQDRRTKEEILLEQILDLTDGQLPEVVASLSLRELKKIHEKLESGAWDVNDLYAQYSYD